MSIERVAPLAPVRIAAPFDHEDWFFELKHDGWRCVAYLLRGRPAELVSRNANVYKRFDGLAAAIAAALPFDAVLDGEIVCLDAAGRSMFYDLFRRRGEPCFYVFDILWLRGRDLRDRPLRERKAILRDLFSVAKDGIIVADHVVGAGVALFDEVCRRDCEGVIAKLADSPYRLLPNGKPPWVKILNDRYSQRPGRQELFNRKKRRS